MAKIIKKLLGDHALMKEANFDADSRVVVAHDTDNVLEVSNVDIKDEDNMASNSASSLATQQSIKAYVDSQVGGQDLDVQGDSGTLDIDLDSEVLDIAGGTGVTTSASGTTLTVNLDAAQTGITSILATDVKIGEDDETKIDFGVADKIEFFAGNEKQLILEDGALYPGADNILDLGKSGVEFKDAFFDGTVTSDAFAGPLTGDVTGNADTATTLATARTIGGVSFDGSANINLPGVNAAGNQDTSGNAATATILETARTIAGQSFNGSANITIAAADLSDVTSVGSGAIITGAERSKLSGIEASADVTDTANVKAALHNADLGGAMTIGDGNDTITFGQDVIVTGDLTVSGDTVTVNTATLSVEDPLIQLANGNNGADAIDIGMYGLYDTSGTQDLYSGLFRDASDSGKWKLFKDLQVAPTATVNTSGAGYTAGTLVAALEGNASTATKWASSINIGGVAVDGSASVNLPGVNATGNQDTSGNAATATALATARTIGGVSFDGTANITLPGVNATGNQNTSGTAAALTTARAIALTGDVTGTANFDGSAGISIASTIGAGAVEADMLNDDLMSGQDAELVTGLAATDELLVSDAGVLKRMDISVIDPLLFGVLADEVGCELSVGINAGNGEYKLRRRHGMFKLRVDYTGGVAAAHQYGSGAITASASAFDDGSATDFGARIKETANGNYLGRAPGAGAGTTTINCGKEDSATTGGLDTFRALAALCAQNTTTGTPEAWRHRPQSGGGHEAFLILYSNNNYTGEVAIFQATASASNDGSNVVTCQWQRGPGTMATHLTDGTANTANLSTQDVKSWAIVEGAVLCHKTAKQAMVDYVSADSALVLLHDDFIEGDDPIKVDWDTSVYRSTDVNGDDEISELVKVDCPIRGKYVASGGKQKAQIHLDLDGLVSSASGTSARSFFVHVRR